MSSAAGDGSISDQNVPDIRSRLSSDGSDWGKCGYITKSGAQFYARFQLRWFELDARRLVLRYYDDSTQEKKLLREIDLTLSRCTIIGVSKSKGVYALHLITPERTFELQFEIVEDKDSWWVALLRAQDEARHRDIENAGGLNSYVVQTRGGSASARDLPQPVQQEPEEGFDLEPSAVVPTTSMVSSALNAYEELLKAIIRPPRAEYVVEALGPPRFLYLGVEYERIDAEVLNSRGQILQYSVWQTTIDDRDKSMQRVVVYMHGNASARMEAVSILSLCLYIGCTVVGVDCTGSGNSAGEYISLGHFERDDLKALVAQLRNPPKNVHYRAVGQNVAVWGRSMGSVAALLWASTRDPSGACLILDSPFASFEMLALDIVRKASRWVPGLVAKVVLRQVSNSIHRRAHFELSELDCLRAAPTCSPPALYIAANDDTLIAPNHAAMLQKSHGEHVKVGEGDGVKSELVTCEGGHNTPRELKVYAHVERFLRQHLLKEGGPAHSASLPLSSQNPSAGQCTFAARLSGLKLRSPEAQAAIASLPPWILDKVLLRAGRHLDFLPDDVDPFQLQPSTTDSSFVDVDEHEQFVPGMTETRQRYIEGLVSRVMGSSSAAGSR